MTEKRATPRHRVLKRGTLAFGGGGIDCTVRNLSASGARVDIASPLGLPQNFTLVIEADQFIRRCRPVWNTDRQLGVVFE
ncbi:MAG: PilZ domain-containing protein [Pseudomonadota bacterium]